MRSTFKNNAEWLEADGLGGFASGTVGGARTRRYHALLLTATTPPAGRIVLVNGLDAWVQTPAGTFALSSQRYTPGRDAPRWRAAHRQLYSTSPGRAGSFASTTAPRSSRRSSRATASAVVRHPLARDRSRNRCQPVGATVSLRARLPLTASRKPVLPFRCRRHATNGSCGGLTKACRVSFRSPTRPTHTNRRGIATSSTRRSASRGLDCTEDLASPGYSALGSIARRGYLDPCRRGARRDIAVRRRRTGRHEPVAARAEEQRRANSQPACIAPPMPTWSAAAPAKPSSPAIRGSPIGAATLSSRLRGLCLATGRLDDARAHPPRLGRHRFGGHAAQSISRTDGDAPEFNSVDASLWFVIAVHDLLCRRGGRKRRYRAPRSPPLEAAVDAIVEGYSHGTRYGIRMDDDGLLAAGEPGVQLTWMDAKVGDWVVTPRIGKPVEVQALWLNALRIAARPRAKWSGRLRARHTPHSKRASGTTRRLPLRRGRRRPSTPATSTPRSGPIRSSPSAACRSRSSNGEQARAGCRRRRSTSAHAAGPALPRSR